MSEVNTGSPERSGGNKFATFLKNLRKPSDSNIQPETQAVAEAPVETIDDRSLAYLDQKVQELGLPNSFGPGVNVFPHDPGLVEERRFVSMDYPVLRTGGRIENGWETVIVDDLVEVWLQPQGDDEPVVKKYTLDDWLSMQQKIIQKQLNQVQQEHQLRKIGEAVADDRYAEHLEDIERDPEYQRLANEAAQSGNRRTLEEFEHTFLTNRLKKEAQFLPFVPQELLGSKSSSLKPFYEVVDLDRIIGVDGPWSDWRGRHGGKGGKSNQIDSVEYGTSGEHIVHLAEAKLNGTFLEETDEVELEQIYSSDGTYYRVVLGGHRIAADKLLGGKVTASYKIVRGATYNGNFGEMVKAVTKERIANNYVAQTQVELTRREAAKKI